MEQGSNKSHEEMINDLRNYAKMRVDLLKLEFVEKLSRIIAVLLVVLLAGVFVAIAIFYLTLAFIYWSETLFGSQLPGFFITSGVLLLIAALIYALKNKLFIDPLVRVFSSIFFEPDNENIDDDDTV
ncbi:MAG: phage holin family protein [Bacteroidales bacterium]